MPARKKVDSATAFIYIVLGVVLALLLVAGGYYIGIKTTQPNLSVLGTSTTSTPPPASASSQVASITSAAMNKCTQNGGFITTARRGTIGYYQICNFEDDMLCELYALYRGDCPVGGVHTIGYSTTSQVYCALVGGKPGGTNNGQCKLPNGTTCSTTAVYNDTCSSD